MPEPLRDDEVPSRDLLDTFQREIRELADASPESDQSADLLARFADVVDQPRPRARSPRALPPSVADQEVALNVLGEAIARSDESGTGTDVVLAPALDMTAVTAAAASMDAAAERVSQRVAEELAEVRTAVASQLANAIHELDAAATAITGARQDQAAATDAALETTQRSIDQALDATERAVREVAERLSATADDANGRIVALTEAAHAGATDAAANAERLRTIADEARAELLALHADARASVESLCENVRELVRTAMDHVAASSAAALEEARQSRKALLSDARTARTQLVKETKKLHASLLADARATADALATDLRASMQPAVEHVEHQLAAAVEQLARQANAASAGVTANAVKLDETVLALQHTAASLQERAANLASQADSLEAGAELLAGSAAALDGRAADMTTALERTAAGAAAAFGERDQELQRELDVVRDRMQAIAEECGSAVATLAGTNNAAAHELAAIQGVAKRFASSTEKSALALLARVEGAVSGLDKQIRDLQKVASAQEERARAAEAELRAELIDARRTYEALGTSVLEGMDAMLNEARERAHAVVNEMDQSRGSAADVVRSVEEAARTVAERLDTTAREFDGSAGRFVARLQDLHDRSMARLNDDGGAVVGSVRGVAVEITQQLEAMRASLASAVETYSHSAAALQRTGDAAEGELVSIKQAAADFAERARTGAQAALARLEDVLHGLETGTQDMRRVAAEQDEHARAAEAELRRELSEARRVYEELGASLIESLQEVIIETRTRASEAVRGADAVNTASEQRLGELASLTASLTRRFDEVDAAIAAAVERCGSAGVSLSATGEAVAREARAASEALSAAVGRGKDAEKLVQELAATSARATAHMQELASAADRSRQLDEEALERAIAMLGVLESFDDLLLAVRDVADHDSSKRLTLLEREAQHMARLVELEEIGTSGVADPDRHDIVATLDVPSARPGMIVQVRSSGYSFRGRVLRPAQVVTAA